jgi:hypothetical protein
MNTTNTDVLKQFSTVVNRNRLTEELYNDLLKCWDLDKVDLDEEYIKIQTKKSSLTRSRREAVPEFIRLRNLLKEKAEQENSSIVMENDTENSMITGGDFSEEIITNQNQVELNAEIC